MAGPEGRMNFPTQLLTGAIAPFPQPLGNVPAAGPGAPLPSIASRIVESMRESVLITEGALDPPGPRIVYVNPAFTRMTGYEADEVLGKTPRILEGPKTDAEWVRRLRNDLSHGRKFEGESVNYRKDGSEFHICWYVEPIRGPDGAVTHYLAVQSDVTEQRRTEQARREAEQKYRSIYENAVHGIFQSAPSGRYLAVNPALAAMYGYGSPEEMMKTLTQIGTQLYVRPERREEFVELLDRDGVVSHFESQVRRKDGSQIWISEHARAVRGAVGEVLYYEGTVQDITARKLAEERAAEQAALLSKAHDAIIVLNLDTTIRFWNEGATRLYGWTEEEVLGRRIEEFHADQSELFNAFSAAIEKGDWSGELRQKTKAGEALVVESLWSLVRGDAGEPRSVLLVNTDITDRRRIERQFLQSQRMENIGMLAGGIAHDLNNVLAPILMASVYLRPKLPDPESRKIIGILEESAQRGAGLVKQVLAFSRGLDGGHTAVQVRHVMSEIVKLARQTFPKGIRVRRDAPDALWPVLGDATQLHQVLLNLCVNARDALPERGGTITMSGSNKVLAAPLSSPMGDLPPGKYVLLEVTDTGTGIPAEVMDKIFDPFFTTKDVGKGTGLGLSTVLNIVKSHAGCIHVTSDRKSGTKFSIHLPAATGEADVSTTGTPSPLALGEGETLLVVDDEAAILEITKETLETFGYRVRTAHGGLEAVQILEEEGAEISLALVDLMMPHMDGRATISELRRLHPDLKVIVASGLMEPEMENIAGAFLAKPYSLRNLLSTLRQVLAE